MAQVMMIADSNTNIIEEQFIREYLDNIPHSRESFRQRNLDITRDGGTSLYMRFDYLLNTALRSVSDQQFSDFCDRFTFLRKRNDSILVETGKPTTPTTGFTRTDNNESVPTLLLDGYDILNSTGEIAMASYVGSFNSFHLYSCQVLFCGVVAEIICQMPPSYLNSSAKYYYTYDFIEERYESHYVRINLYEHN
jgi:hypothetical protein